MQEAAYSVHGMIVAVTAACSYRFDTFEKMKAWMLDIKNEAHNMSVPEEEGVDWWSALFDTVISPPIQYQHQHHP